MTAAFWRALASLGRHLLFLLGVPIFLLPRALPFSPPAMTFPTLAAYVFGAGLVAASELGFRRFAHVAAATAALLSLSAAPIWLAVPLAAAGALTAFYFLVVHPALLFGRERLPFALLIIVLSTLIALPLALLPLPFGTVYDPEFVEHVLRENPLYTRLNWIRYALDMAAYKIAMRATIRILSRGQGSGPSRI